MKKHIDFIDTAKGFCAFLVMLSHIEITPKAYSLFMAPIFLSVFFFFSGFFLNANNYRTPLIFIKNKIFRLLLPWIVISYVSEIITISTIRKITNNPYIVFESFIGTSQRIIIGKSIWFVPCLIVSLLISYLIFYFFKNNKIVFICSLILFILGIVFARKQEYTIWSINTALVNQIFIIVGSLTGKLIIANLDRIRKYGVHLTTFSLLSYIISLYILKNNNYYSGFGIRLNIYNNFLTYALLNCLGIIFILFLSVTLKKLPLITFMGSHSLFYFAFGAHGYRIGGLLLETITSQFSFIKQFITNPYVSSIFICVIASIFMGILARVVDYFVPILNGKIELGSFINFCMIKIKNLRKVNNKI